MCLIEFLIKAIKHYWHLSTLLWGTQQLQRCSCSNWSSHAWNFLCNMLTIVLYHNCLLIQLIYNGNNLLDLSFFWGLVYLMSLSNSSFTEPVLGTAG